jgi:hypothetical protein
MTFDLLPGRTLEGARPASKLSASQTVGANRIMRIDSRSQVTDPNCYKASLCAATSASERHSSSMGAGFPLSSSHASPRSVGIGLLSR